MIINESDTAWKEILDAYFKDFLEYCLPILHELIDWHYSWIPLDKELQSITKLTESGKKLVDKLFKVSLKDGQEQWILIHIEVQDSVDKDFSKRMFTYGYRIYDKYQKPVINCAILTDQNAEWRPNSYKIGFRDSYLKSKFLIVKLIDYQNQLDTLEKSNNPFASVILTQLTASAMKSKSNEFRKQTKFALTKRLYMKGYNKMEVNNLYKFIDWLIGLPRSLELEYLQEVYALEEQENMPYISRAERFGLEEGLAKGLQQGLQQGIEQGIEQGFIQCQLRIAANLLIDGKKVAEIEKITGLSQTKIIELQKKQLEEA